jgi:hypothetical protein
MHIFKENSRNGLQVFSLLGEKNVPGGVGHFDSRWEKMS